MAGGGNSPVVAIKLNGASNGVPESWNEGKLLAGDVVLQVSICSDLESFQIDASSPVFSFSLLSICRRNSRIPRYLSRDSQRLN